jgi:hypothetical protein
MKDFTEIRLKAWKELHDLAQPNWIYRGQGDASWELSTSIERCFAREGIAGNNRAELEKELVREFRRTYHNYAVHIPERERLLEWLSLMQHHGAPTRLLDFTYSIYVAAYFAVEKATRDSAIWAVSASWAMNRGVEALEAAGKHEAQTWYGRTEERHEEVGESLLMAPPRVPSILVLSPYRMNERLRTQKGTFVVPGDVTSSFMDNLRAMKGHEQKKNLLKIVLPASLRSKAVESLHYMNISRTSLFPGLDGYAQSLGVYHPSYRPVDWSEE